jgi:hypothetical protein
MRRPVAVHSLAQQAFALHASFPEADVRLSPRRLAWRGTITPTALSREYAVRITYTTSRFPKTRVLAPTLRGRPGESIPHLFSDGSLCLHLDEEWSASMLLVRTIVPWTSEWLFNYEIWLATATWNGGGDWPPRRQANSTASSNMTGSRRRDAARRRPR